MRYVQEFKAVWLAAAIVAMTIGFATAPAVAQTSAIEGTWNLVGRDLPDGKKVMSPDIQGLMTFTKGYRNINVLWRTPDGKWGSFSAIAAYKLSSSEYTETLQFSAFNDPASGKGVEYIVGGGTKSSPVEKEGRVLHIQPPFDPPSWNFDGDKQTSILKGAFVDHWERVK